MSTKVSVAPSASRLSRSLRDIGYSFESAVADLIDNSIAAKATQIDVDIFFEGRNSYLTITDNGNGMNGEELNEAMRFGTRRSYQRSDLGRYGLGLKTASLSQCRRVEVVSRKEEGKGESRVLDLDYLQSTDQWSILDYTDEEETAEALERFAYPTGTVITWRKLDRLLPVKSPESGWGRRRIENLGPRLEKYLSMVFHRFLSGEAFKQVTISVNGKSLQPWDPFVRHEDETSEFETNEFELEHGDSLGTVTLRRFLLPQRDKFSSRQAFDDASGVDKWNKQQGLYIYRADRLVQWGGWSGIRTIDEHLKLARASLDFDTPLDEAFNINVAKMRVTLPSELKKMLARPVNELCIAADAAYRKGEARHVKHEPIEQMQKHDFGGYEAGQTIGLNLRAAAARTGHAKALNEVFELLKKEAPEVAEYLGFN
ncbi:ATP-binding protein [uncultured Corynebacterium sp.]|uniref:ATP-binding protein n=1 Tax=uncultured Corynebacterium sp. TaxID=159447 RepID=UPI0025FBE041|nr:ATP-binding protein [uncultured Corynebacterium sp.]